LQAYELPQASDAASRVILNRNADQIRVYVHPEMLQILRVIDEQDRLMNIIFSIHGQLLFGNIGSAIVELAASWAIMMLVTGLYLWWPRQGRGFAGVVYPRFDGGTRLFWRDLHAVTGVWISGLALFLLLTGLPWAKVWGEYFTEVRRLTGTAVAQQDWTVGAARPDNTQAVSEEHMGHSSASEGHPGAAEIPPDYSAIDRLIGIVRPLNLAPPVLISPPAKGASTWTAKSDAQNRLLRVNLVLDGVTGAILTRENFKDRHFLDRVVAVGVAAHEGQLFGWPNQLLSLLTASGLLLLVTSAVAMWWRRRPYGMLGAPQALENPRRSFGLMVILLLFGLYLPLFAASLIVVLLVERSILRRFPSTRNWLGLK
jgi:uncharacterized iron-regulated membrane protein